VGEHGGQFSGLSPDELVAWQQGHPAGYELLDLLQRYVTDKGGRFRAREWV